eukprot:CAMPEP_0175074806 /NCGR_PEP_ID=MMETSP0052_2-20121109/21555_1 /TAXON_ID=51329 ORGANISM="Polytomella parva, Strain SAG 63-3" /NCGR_SAMPLE_ID=MMETSP0052_2 /ASSEMBLY_ACC=CAM_ASM_000194 /LENGTH=125 /DNA_ID=CAMNT_0016343233 /DNA_START=8 /DNA_END=385 /DNA_ORIENTATION=-
MTHTVNPSIHGFVIFASGSVLQQSLHLLDPGGGLRNFQRELIGGGGFGLEMGLDFDGRFADLSGRFVDPDGGFVDLDKREEAKGLADDDAERTPIVFGSNCVDPSFELSAAVDEDVMASQDGADR